MGEIEKQTEQNKDNKGKKELIDYLPWILAGLFFFALLVLGGAFLAYWLHFGHYEISEKPEDWGPFGDFIGGVANPLLAFLSLIAILFTIYLQASELRETRKEIIANQDILRKQSETMDSQARDAFLQRIDNVFFNNLENLKEIKNSIKFGTSIDPESLDYTIISFGNIYSRQSLTENSIKEFREKFMGFVEQVTHMLQLLTTLRHSHPVEFRRYVKTLYNRLSHNQKYLIQICRETDIFKFEGEEYLTFFEDFEK